MSKKLKDIVKNKSIVIIGPSPSLLEKENGKLIDSYDIVIRVKKGYPIKDHLKKNLGEKLDILCTHLKLSQNNLDQESLKQIYKSECRLIYMPYPITVDPFKRFYNNFVPYYKNFLMENNKLLNRMIEVDTGQEEIYNKHSKKMNTTPTTGIAMILDLLECDYKELFITGFTFRLDGYYEDYKTKEEDKESYIRTFVTRQIHNTNNEANYLKPLLLNKNNIKLDDKLKSILENI
jgi:hypothetical protein